MRETIHDQIILTMVSPRVSFESQCPAAECLYKVEVQVVDGADGSRGLAVIEIYCKEINDLSPAAISPTGTVSYEDRPSFALFLNLNNSFEQTFEWNVCHAMIAEKQSGASIRYRPPKVTAEKN